MRRFPLAVSPKSTLLAAHLVIAHAVEDFGVEHHAAMRNKLAIAKHNKLAIMMRNILAEINDGRPK